MSARTRVVIHWKDKSVDRFESSDVKMGDQFLQPNLCIKFNNREYYIIPSCRLQHIQAKWEQYGAQHRLASLELVVNYTKKDIYPDLDDTDNGQQPE